MSANIVSNLHISAMLEIVNDRPGQGLSYYWNHTRHTFKGSKQEIGDKLLAENLRSVDYRYNFTADDLPAPAFHHCDPNWTPTAIEVVKLCDCYMYQASETPDWKESEAFAIATALRENAIYNLPGYREAYWSLS